MEFNNKQQLILWQQVIPNRTVKGKKSGEKKLHFYVKHHLFWLSFKHVASQWTINFSIYEYNTFFLIKTPKVQNNLFNFHETRPCFGSYKQSASQLCIIPFISYQQLFVIIFIDIFL